MKLRVKKKYQVDKKDDEENSGTRDRDMFLNEKQINSTGGKEGVLYLNQRFKISKVKIDRYKQKK